MKYKKKYQQFQVPVVFMIFCSVYLVLLFLNLIFRGHFKLIQPSPPKKTSKRSGWAKFSGDCHSGRCTQFAVVGIFLVRSYGSTIVVFLVEGDSSQNITKIGIGLGDGLNVPPKCVAVGWWNYDSHLPRKSDSLIQQNFMGKLVNDIINLLVDKIPQYCWLAFD